MADLNHTLKSLGPVRLMAMICMAAFVVGFIWFVAERISKPSMSLLYGNLDQADSSSIVAKLDISNTPYEIKDGGKMIYVPSKDVDRLRLMMAAESLPNKGSIGYEIFDQSDHLGTTNFVQNVNLVRALEGELTKTIQSIGHIASARVHLVLPQRELFSKEKMEPRASVVIQTKGGVDLSNGQIIAIQHLVSAAVQGLKPQSVAITDTKGTLLAKGTGEDSNMLTANNAEEMRKRYEEQMAHSIEELLSKTIGPDKVRAEVSAEMDFDRFVESVETFDPEGQVVRSTQTVDEKSSGGAGAAGGAVSAGQSLPNASDLSGGGAGGNSTTRVEETVNYEISKIQRNHTKEAGTVKRISVAVLVDGQYTTDEAGKKTYAPRDEASMTSYRKLVESAIGYNEERGDKIEVVNMQFLSQEEITAEAEPASTLPLGLTKNDIFKIVESLLMGLAALILVLKVIKPAIQRILNPTPVDTLPLQIAHEGPRGSLPAPAANNASMNETNQVVMPESELMGDDMVSIQKVEGKVKASFVKKIEEMIDQNPEQAVAIVRNWMYQE